MSDYANPDAPHGTLDGYKNYGCRCDRCRRANADYQLDLTDRLADALARGEATPPHGKPSTYRNYRCRCVPCRKAYTQESRESRERRQRQAAS